MKKTISPVRHKDDGTQVLDFFQRYSVVCPQCSSQATVATESAEHPIKTFTPRRLICTACGFSKKWAASQLRYPSPDLAIDWYFRLPFYFKKSCAGHLLWVANREHLEWLRSYVSAKHRVHNRNEEGWSNRSLASRIPKWISSAKNRLAVLKALNALERKICETLEG